MIREEAIEALSLLRIFDEPNLDEAVKMAVAALRSQVGTLPNEPLTLEQLLEMDGEPVWVERPGYGRHWALVQVCAKSTSVIYLILNNGAVLHPQVELDCGGKFYRRKPEEGEI